MGEGTQHWIVMPFVNLWEMTQDALDDCLRQMAGNSRILAISNGSDGETHDRLREFAAAFPRILPWHHQPPLLALAATWNQALDFVWEVGGERAMVVNNDVRLHPDTYRSLSHVMDQEDALFVTATGVTREQFEAAYVEGGGPTEGMLAGRGGPDFSCFLISKGCHEKYRFDENYIPAFCEDLDFHRQMMIGGDKSRIFGINLPFLHIDAGSNTIKSFNEKQRESFGREVAAFSRAYYEKKWGGSVNQEASIDPFAEGGPFTLSCGCVTTPELQFCDHEAPSPA